MSIKIVKEAIDKFNEDTKFPIFINETKGISPAGKNYRELTLHRIHTEDPMVVIRTVAEKGNSSITKLRNTNYKVLLRDSLISYFKELNGDK